MSESSVLSPRDVILAAQRAIQDGDVEGFVSLFAADAVLEFPHSAEASLPPRIQGRESIGHMVSAIRDRFQGRQFHTVENLAMHETTDPEVVVVEIEARGDGAGAGEYRMADIQVWRVRDGLVRSVRDYLGTLAPPSARVPTQERTPGISAWG